MQPQLETVQWLFVDPSLLLNEGETERTLRRLLAESLARRGRPAAQIDVERAWMQAISAPQPVHPLAGAARLLAPDAASAAAVVDEVVGQVRRSDTLLPGVQLLLSALAQRFKLGIIGPYRLPGTRTSLVRFHLAGLPVIALGEEQKLSYRLDVGGRPDPALFAWALKKAAVTPALAAFASDRVDLGLAPAKAAGLTTIWLRQSNHKVRHPRTDMERPDITLESLADLARG